MLTRFELWLSACKENNTLLFCIEGSGDTGIYETKTQYMQHWNYYYTSPVFHVWIKGKCAGITQNINVAYTLYNNLSKDTVDLATE